MDRRQCTEEQGRPRDGHEAATGDPQHLCTVCPAPRACGASMVFGTDLELGFRWPGNDDHPFTDVRTFCRSYLQFEKRNTLRPSPSACLSACSHQLTTRLLPSNSILCLTQCHFCPESWEGMPLIVSIKYGSLATQSRAGRSVLLPVPAASPLRQLASCPRQVLEITGSANPRV